MRAKTLAERLKKYAQHGEVPARQAVMELAADVLEQFDGSTEFWTLWAPDHVCSKHKTLAAAERAAKDCEARGGATHTIYAVAKLQRKG